MEFFRAEALIFNKIFSSEQGKNQLFRNSSGVNTYSSVEDPQVFRGDYNFVEFFKGKKKRR